MPPSYISSYSRSACEILCIGAAHLDRRGRIDGPFYKNDSNPGTMLERVGGVAFNLACNLAQLDYTVGLLSVKGTCEAPSLIDQDLKKFNISDYRLVLSHTGNASYTAILDHTGELVIALADMALYDHLTIHRVKQSLDEIPTSALKALIVDSNIPEETLNFLGAYADKHALNFFAIATSQAKVRRLQSLGPVCKALFMNYKETCALIKKPHTTDISQRSLKTDKRQTDAIMPSIKDLIQEIKLLGFTQAYITQGPGRIYAFDQNQICQHDPPKQTGIKDVTGAGDAFAAGVIDTLLQSGGVEAALRSGTHLAQKILHSKKTVSIHDTPYIQP